MTKITVLCNQKGGVGKTVTAVNLGIGLAREGKKVLLVDLDGQGSLTASLGYQHPDQMENTIADMLGRIIAGESLPPDKGILYQEEGVDLIPANIELSGLEVTLVNTMSRETVLREYLDQFRDQYDVILLGCCPSLGNLLNSSHCGMVVPAVNFSTIAAFQAQAAAVAGLPGVCPG